MSRPDPLRLFSWSRAVSAASRLGLGLGLALLCASCTAPTLPPPGGQANVLLITVDTLRPDALGYIGGKNATPAFDGLAAAGFRFDRAITPVPITLPAHTSMLTGLNPPRHGIRDNGQSLGPGVTTIAQHLEREGYATAAFVSGYPLQAMFGLDRGFGHYDDELPSGQEGFVERFAPQTTDAALAWITEQTGPWFVWIHYYDPHDPYEPPRSFWQPGPRGAYDGEVQFTDHAVGRLLAGIPEAARDQLLTVFTADHGEALGEHDERTHGYYIYDSTVRVPLLFHWPGRVPPGASNAAVGLVDLAPTLLELLGVAGMAEGDGISVVPTILGATQDHPAAYVETQLPWRYFGWAPLSGVCHESWKYIRAPRPELYNVTEDPGEQRNLVDAEQALVAKLEQHLIDLETVDGAEPTVAEDPEVLARLRALGYVGSGASVPDPSGLDLADPKDRVEQREQLYQAEQAMRRGALPQALGLFEQVLQVDPDNRSATLRSGILYLRLGRLDQAVERLSAAVGLDPQRAEARFALGDALTRSQRFDAATEQWMELVRLQPRRVEGWANLGTTLSADGRHEEALAAWQEAVTLKPDGPGIRRGLGQAQIQMARQHVLQARMEAARLLLAQALEATPELRSIASADPDLSPLLN